VSPKPTKDITDPKVIKALAHPLRLRILGVLHGRIASPSELAEEFEAPIGNVSYHVRILQSMGLIRLVRTTPKRGAIEHHYEAVARPVVTDETWGQLPASVKRALVNASLDHTGAVVRAAALRGGFNHAEARLTRTTLVLDDEGWQTLSRELVGATERALEIAQESEARLRGQGKAGDGAMLVLVSFEPRPTAEPERPRRATRRKRRSSARA
jgi:DNA-binding transcriptional ArsR family regulator